MVFGCVVASLGLAARVVVTRESPKPYVLVAVVVVIFLRVVGMLEAYEEAESSSALGKKVYIRND